ncbi:glycosyltransferase [Amycolatopsis sp. K13G38]|uniref:Glycosyltransferase n=2 Tax=Amycolatopsis acididurans TaxID=2724524 RepID=A0ABX1J8L9_9PSEU|nr:glycosyltransferase [Amycolatopsis acididurans]
MAAALLLYGYVRHDVGGSTTGHPAAGSDSVPESLREGGPVVDLQHGPLRARKPSPRTVALTFDDGPDPQWTPQVLQVLARRHVPATFFVLGAHVLQYPDLVRQEVAAGHEIGAHTFTHADLGGVPAWRQRLELSQTEVALAGTTGLATSLLRPPYASNSDSLDDKDWAVVRRSAALGYVTVFADRDGEDWARPGVDQIVNNAMPQGDDGAIVLLHDAGGDRAQTVAALDELIDRLQQRGYRFTTASAAVGLSSGNAAATPAQRWRGEAVLWAYRASVAVSVALQVLLSAVGVLMLGRVLLLVAIARRHARRRRNGWAATPSEPVSVVVPAYQECEHIQATVRALAASDHPEFEILVVDDGSTDGTADLVEELNLPGVRVIRKPNGGKPSALNTGIAHARHDLLVFVDADTVFQPDTIRRLVAPFADPGIGAVSGNAKVGNRRGLLGRWQHIEYVVGFNLDRRTYDVLGCMPTVPGAVGAFRRAAMDEVGGVSDDTLAEDTDVTLALVGAGWRVVYEERAVAWTEAPASLGQLWKQRYRWCYGTVQAMWKHRGTILRRGPAGRLGRRGLVFLGLFQVLLPLIAPVMDGYLLYGLVFLDPLRTALVWSGLFLLQVLSAVYAFRLDAERLRPLWTLPLQQIFYRQLMYLVVIQSVVTAVSGVRMGWHKLRRTNTVEVPDLPAGR